MSSYLLCCVPDYLVHKLPHVLSPPLADMQYRVWLYVGSGELNSGPHVYNASTLPMELSPQSHLCVLQPA